MAGAVRARACVVRLSWSPQRGAGWRIAAARARRAEADWSDGGHADRDWLPWQWQGMASMACISFTFAA
ncbi:Uncharacterized protein DAT39_015755, partial [Clarias magur]